MTGKEGIHWYDCFCKAEECHIQDVDVTLKGGISELPRRYQHNIRHHSYYFCYYYYYANQALVRHKSVKISGI